MKIIFVLMMMTSVSAFAQKEEKMVGENANPAYKTCLGADSCPSQRCSNSCAMINGTQQGADRSSASAVKSNKKRPTGSVK